MSFVRVVLRIPQSWRGLRGFPSVTRLLQHPTCQILRKTFIPFRFLLLPSAVGIVRAASPDQTDLTSLKHTICQADHLFDSNKFQELYDFLLPYKESNQVDLLWRFARAAYKLGLQDGGRKLQLLTEGFEAAKRSVNINDQSAQTHKWMSILLDAYSEAHSFRERCKNLLTVKEHMVVSTELDPSDATVWYMLGLWYVFVIQQGTKVISQIGASELPKYYGMSDLSWYKVKILNAVGGITYKSSYEEALACFEKAEQIDPDFYSLNHLMLGKTYLKLQKDKEKAVFYLKKAADVPALTEDDRRAKKEASDLLKHIH